MLAPEDEEEEGNGEGEKEDEGGEEEEEDDDEERPVGPREAAPRTGGSAGGAIWVRGAPDPSFPTGRRRPRHGRSMHWFVMHVCTYA